MVNVEVTVNGAHSTSRFVYAEATIGDVFDVLVVGEGHGTRTDHVLVYNGIRISAACVETLMRITNGETPPNGMIRMSLVDAIQSGYDSTTSVSNAQEAFERLSMQNGTARMPPT